jgi:hypothetical protein
MPFVPLSTDGTQRATTETLRAPRVQVALEPHEAGVTVLAIEPTGLRAIGQLDLTVADGYRRVLAPLAMDGLYGICIAESTDTGTVLCLAPPECCLPAGDWPWRPDHNSAEGSAELAAWLAAPAPPAPAPAPTRSTASLGVGAVGGAPPRRSAHRRHARPDRRAAAPWVLAGIIGLLMVGAITQALTGGRTATPAALAAADTAAVPVPGWAQGPPTTEPPVVIAAPAAVSEPAADDAPPARPAAPAPAAPKPQQPAPPPAPKHSGHDDAVHEDEHSSHPDDGGSGSSDAKKDDAKKDDAKSSGSSSSGSSGSSGSGTASDAGGKGSSPAKDKRPSLADLLRQLAGQHSGDGRPRSLLPHLGR